MGSGDRPRPPNPAQQHPHQLRREDQWGRDEATCLLVMLPPPGTLKGLTLPTYLYLPDTDTRPRANRHDSSKGSWSYAFNHAQHYTGAADQKGTETAEPED